MTLEFIDGNPLCERCMSHWWIDRPRLGNATAYFRRYHATNGHT